MSNFEKRVERAAKIHAARSAANGRAKKVQDDKRDAFLVRFYDLSRTVAMPAMVEMQKPVEAPGMVQVQIERSEDENEICFELIDGRKRSVLVFVADPISMRVRIAYSLQLDMDDPGDSFKWREARRGVGDVEIRATITLEDMTAEGIKSYVAEFVERAFGI